MWEVLCSWGGSGCSSEGKTSRAAQGFILQGSWGAERAELSDGLSTLWEVLPLLFPWLTAHPIPLFAAFSLIVLQEMLSSTKETKTEGIKSFPRL